MLDFLSKYPRTGEALIILLISMVGWFIVDMRNTYVKASDKMVSAYEQMAAEVKAHSIKIAEHEVRISVCEKGS